MLECLSSAILLRPIGYEIRRKLCIWSLKSCQSCLSCRHQQYGSRGTFTSRFGGVGSRHFETHGPRPHKVPGSGFINFERVSESKLRERVKQNKDHAE
jgi:hypothetical protein